MSSIFSSKSRKTVAAIALVVTTGLSAAACGSSDDTTPASSSAAPAPEPVATIDSLTVRTGEQPRRGTGIRNGSVQCAAVLG